MDSLGPGTSKLGTGKAKNGFPRIFIVPLSLTCIVEVSQVVYIDGSCPIPVSTVV